MLPNMGIYMGATAAAVLLLLGLVVLTEAVGHVRNLTAPVAEAAFGLGTGEYAEDGTDHRLSLETLLTRFHALGF